MSKLNEIAGEIEDAQRALKAAQHVPVPGDGWGAEPEKVAAAEHALQDKLTRYVPLIVAALRFGAQWQEVETSGVGMVKLRELGAELARRAATDAEVGRGG